MRLSVNDPDFPSDKHLNAEVYLNDKRVECCTTADEEGGYIERWVTSKTGVLLLEQGTKREHGKVKIVLRGE